MATALAKRRARLFIPLVVVAVLTAGCFGTSGQGVSTNGLNGQLLDRVNADRAAHGLPGLQWDAQLNGLAQEWSHYMAGTGSLHHRDLSGVLYRPEYAPYQRLGENILVGSCGMTAEQVESAWMNSPSHRANIVGNFNRVGIGSVCIDGRLWATQNFGLR